MNVDFLKSYDFFAGVPDSQLKPLCDYLMATYGISDRHIIAANEGNAVALAAGYHLATGKIPVVYMQNSGIGNIINPVASLMNDQVYGIPCIFVIGWRGESGVHDEPQYEDFATVSPYAQEAVSALIGAGLVNGKSNLIAPLEYTTRAEIAVLIKRILDYTKK